MLPNSTKTRLIENFFAVDLLLFGKPVSKLAESSNMNIFTENIKENVDRAKQEASSLLKSEKSVSEIKKAVVKMLKENISSITSEEVTSIATQSKAFSLALDCLLLNKTIRESSNYEELFNNVTGKVYCDSYSFLKDDLIKSALVIRKMVN